MNADIHVSATYGVSINSMLPTTRHLSMPDDFTVNVPANTLLCASVNSDIEAETRPGGFKSGAEMCV